MQERQENHDGGRRRERKKSRSSPASSGLPETGVVNLAGDLAYDLRENVRVKRDAPRPRQEFDQLGEGDGGQPDQILGQLLNQILPREAIPDGKAGGGSGSQSNPERSICRR